MLGLKSQLCPRELQPWEAGERSSLEARSLRWDQASDWCVRGRGHVTRMSDEQEEIKWVVWHFQMSRYLTFLTPQKKTEMYFPLQIARYVLLY